MPDVEDVVFLQPGPVKIHPRVQRAMGRPTVHHRSQEFTEVVLRLSEGLQSLFQTRHDVTVLTGSGTAGMEAAVGGLAGRGDRVVALDNGKFGGRMADIAGMHAECVRVKAEWGQGFDMDAVAAALEEAPTKVLAFVYNETSTGTVNQGKELCALAKKHDALVVMDAITALGSVPVPVEDWGVDVCVTGSQKCIAGPPGLSLVSVAPRAFDELRRFSYYLDLKKHVEKMRGGSTPFTPAVPLYMGMLEAVDIALEEGLEQRFLRTRRLAEAMRAATEALGLEFFAADGFRSDTITSVRYPEVADAEKKIRGRMKSEFGVLIAGGQDATKGKIFRVGHMANANASELVACLHALEVCLKDAGHGFERGAGLRAASEILG